ncbi:Cygnin [Dryobates pubescens]|uniref:Cygnin n=1 Tax=Dryobates pubescens TaxID=118200 RepID=A0A093GUJ5_DRYPU|nr:Cygnin [Dryobates pubescens]
MRFLYLVFTVFLLVSFTVPGYGQIVKHCPKAGYCSTKCEKAELWSYSTDCKDYCCIPYTWKGK